MRFLSTWQMGPHVKQNLGLCAGGNITESSIFFKLEVRGYFVSALFAEVGNITNISFFEPNEENMLCFVTFWCEQAKLRARPRAVW